ncbi:MAG TPA: Gfo/Idh/MocA family oxidoreductase [Tepidisphaeraceae bacterium]|jgi:myo-inositol 2-dehydrogenase/D-chiro-inositol 1-dehydrogenase|nr:Gfo/Idh/MocA family oxidoreductase [Tepidisphaeraceae bacterium]
MSQVRFGLIGYGAWGSHHARAIEENANAKLVGIAAKSAGTIEKAKSERPGARVYGDWREMLAKEEMDVVAVVLPTDLHHEIGKAVLESGRHLLLEKPMALSVAQCDDLLATAERKKKLLAIGHEFRLSSLWGKVKEMIDAGAIGEPRYALIELWRRPYRQGAEGWRYDINRVGNWILEEPIHFFDLARWYFQKSGEPIAVTAQASERRKDHPELQDNFSAMLRFSNGGYAVISQTLAAWEHHQVVKVTGREGAIWASWSGAMDRTFEPTFSLKHQHGDKLETVPVTKITGEVYELVDQVGRVVSAVRDGTPLPTTGRDGRWSVAMCLKAQESVLSGREVGFE